MGIDENFGVGAKVSSLPNNKLGMRIRSCKSGRVSEVILGEDTDLKRYVRFERDLGNGSGTVIDVTARRSKEGRDIGDDWTEVSCSATATGRTPRPPDHLDAETDKGFIATSLTGASIDCRKGSS